MLDKDQLLEGWLKREGEVFTDRGDDRGGPTKFGLTLKLLRSFRHDPDIHPSVLQDMGWPEAREIIWKVFAEDTYFTLVEDPLLFEMLWDAAGNHGPTQAVKLLQRALMIQDDGVFGPVTKEAIRWLHPLQASLLFQVQRERLYALIASRNKEDNDHDGIPDALENLPGWINRSAGLTEKIAWSIKAPA